jgi:hypothetical protein
MQHVSLLFTFFPLKLLGQIKPVLGWMVPFIIKEYILHTHLHSKTCFLMILMLKHLCRCDQKNYLNLKESSSIDIFFFTKQLSPHYVLPMSVHPAFWFPLNNSNKVPHK